MITRHSFTENENLCRIFVRFVVSLWVVLKRETTSFSEQVLDSTSREATTCQTLCEIVKLIRFELLQIVTSPLQKYIELLNPLKK